MFLLNKYFKLNLYYLLFLIVILNCKENSSNIKENSYSQLFTNHKAGNKELYSNLKPWQERVYPLDEIHKDLIIQMNILDNFDEIPREFKNFEMIHKLIRNIALREDSLVNSLKEKNIFAIYICSNLGGTGISGFVYDNDKVVGGYIIIDGDMIYKKANEWISYKESSVFKNSNPSNLSIKIAESDNNTEEFALNYILLHELGHIISQTMSVLPDQRDKFRDFTKYEFTKNIWLNEEVSMYDDTIFQSRNKLKFYSTNSEFEIDTNAEDIYNSLNKTSFPTLYSAMNPDDYFSECFVSYITIYIYKQPWILTIQKKNGEFHTFENGMKTGRSKKEIDLTKKLLTIN
jgi:hypothetical protein